MRGCVGEVVEFKRVRLQIVQLVEGRFFHQRISRAYLIGGHGEQFRFRRGKEFFTHGKGIPGVLLPGDRVVDQLEPCITHCALRPRIVVGVHMKLGEEILPPHRLLPVHERLEGTTGQRVGNAGAGDIAESRIQIECAHQFLSTLVGPTVRPANNHRHLQATLVGGPLAAQHIRTMIADVHHYRVPRATRLLQHGEQLPDVRVQSHHAVVVIRRLLA